MPSSGFHYNFRVDVFLTGETWSDIRTFGLFRPISGSWGLLIGHRRGFRFIVEKAALVPRGSLPSVTRQMEFDRIWGGRVIGYFAFRPHTSLKREFLSPAFYGKLFLAVFPAGREWRLEPSLIEYAEGFHFSSLALVPGREGGKNG